jgi:hypothetical protein
VFRTGRVALESLGLRLVRLVCAKAEGTVAAASAIKIREAKSCRAKFL